MKFGKSALVDCVGRMRLTIFIEQNDPTGELTWKFQFDRMVKARQGLRITLDIHCCPMLQEVDQKGAVLVKGEREHNLSCACVDGLGFFW